MLIKTKLQIPLLRSRLLYRKHLIQRLSASKSCSLILIEGPAGSGKTSLTCQWIKQDRKRVAWYSLDRDDNESDLFFRYLLTTLIQAERQLEKALGLLLASKWELTGENVIPNLIESLIHVSENICLVLDDFHQIVNAEIHTALTRLIQYIPNCLQLAILSRSCLPAPMDAVSLKKERLEITASDLKFTQQETEELFKDIIPLSFSEDQVHNLNQHVEGWAAGLQLIGLSARSKGHGFDLSCILNQAHEKVTHYLVDEILQMQSEKIRNFVFTTALLDRFTADLCIEVTGIKDAVRILSRLERMNLFLIPLDTKRKWYRYHHMFSKVVRRRVALITPDLILATMRKAALWFAANNYLEEAIRSALVSDDFDFAADLMEENIAKFIIQLDPMTGLRWILKLPLEILKQRTLLRLYQCNFLLILTELSVLQEILEEIESRGNMALARYSDDKRTLCEDFINYLKCMVKILYAKQSTNVINSKMPSKKISAQNQFFLIGIEMLVVLKLISNGELSLAEGSLAKASRLLAPFGMMGKKIYLAKSKALIARHKGQLRHAEAILDQVLPHLDQPVNGNTSTAFLLHRQLGHIFYLQNKLAEARECAAMAVRHCEYSGLIDDILAGNELRLLLHLSAGEKDQAEECIQQMRAYSVKFAMPQITAIADACTARIAVTQGNLGGVLLWSQRRNLKMDEPFSLLFANEWLTQTHLFYARRQYPEAAHFLEPLRNRCLKRGLMELVLQIDIFRSAVFHAMNQYQKAAALLKEALFFSETEGYIRPFVNHSKLIAPILRRLEEELPNTSLNPHFKRIFAACDISVEQTPISRFSEKPGHEDLTQREIEILQWMVKGLQNKEIAQKTCISTNTVKSHVRKILAKLDGKTRSQAIFKANKFGIITRE